MKEFIVLFSPFFLKINIFKMNTLIFLFIFHVANVPAQPALVPVRARFAQAD